MAKGKINKPKRRQKKVAVKRDQIYEAIIYSDKPNCPACDNRDYTITEYGYNEDGFVKFFVRCNVCKMNFIYCKSIAAI